jgi:hypothetical protein
MKSGVFKGTDRKFLRSIFFLPFALIILALAFSSMYRLSSTYDEPAHYRFGKDLITRELKGASMQRMPITALNTLPVYVLEKAGMRLSEHSRLFFSRIPTVAASLLLAFFVFSWTRKLYGIEASLVSLILYAFCPNILAHSQLVTNDVYCACLMFISVYLFTQYARRRSLKGLAAVSVSTGVALLTKQTALLLLPAYGLILLCTHFSLWKDSLPGSCKTSRPTRRSLVHLILFVLLPVN